MRARRFPYVTQVQDADEHTYGKNPTVFNPAGAREAQRAIFFHNNGELARGHAGDWNFMVMNEHYFNQRDGALPHEGFDCECYLQNNPQRAAHFDPARWNGNKNWACGVAYRYWLTVGINDFESATCADRSPQQQYFDCDCYMDRYPDLGQYYVRHMRYRPQVGDGVHAFKNDKFSRNELWYAKPPVPHHHRRL